ncbi:hypothetical protein HYPDE_41298 [Hyphomicrobium denitrificans 1NES1]|uniref:Uncharacterized protein n=1 Tax=Hyphomicrobium denitrificans 1NES1 TaxID=670307 RepID=N0BA84_9HYPH|nr:hypothetical protein HYPDE_41298 [Hyphomicrobium denitrificans 1NES1]
MSLCPDLWKNRNKVVTCKATPITSEIVRSALGKKHIFSLRQLAKAIGVHREKLRRVIKADPALARLTDPIRGWNGPRGGRTIEDRVAIIEEAKRAGKVRTVADALIISDIHWVRYNQYLKQSEAWRRAFGGIPFPDPPHAVYGTGHRAHVLYTKYVRENEAKGIAQPEASWGALDKAMRAVEKHIKKKNAECRKLKWGDASIDVQKRKRRGRKQKFFTKKDADKIAKRRLSHFSTYNLLRYLAASSGKTVDEVAAEGATTALRKKYFAAIAEMRDKKSFKEAVVRTAQKKKERAELEAKAAKFRKRPDLVRHQFSC